MTTACYVTVIAALVLAVLTVCPCPAGAVQNQSLPKTVSVLGKTLTLKDSKGGGAAQPFIAEYIPSEETWDNWTTMFSSRFIPGKQLNAMVSAQSTAAKITARREKGDVVANAAVFQTDDGKSVVVDFIMSEGKVYEHNVWRYFTKPDGLVSFQIARRVYDNGRNEDEIQSFIRSIKDKRSEILKAIMSTDLPVSLSAR
jgi:hypothetical protein